MYSKDISVKNNLGNRNIKIRIISKSKILESDFDRIKGMKLNEVEAYAKIKNWVIRRLE